MLLHFLVRENKFIKTQYSGFDLEIQVKAQFLFKIYIAGLFLFPLLSLIFLFNAPLPNNTIILKAFFSIILILIVSMIPLCLKRYELSVSICICLGILSNFIRNVFPDILELSTLTIMDSTARLMLLILFILLFSKSYRMIALTYLLCVCLICLYSFLDHQNLLMTRELKTSLVVLTCTTVFGFLLRSTNLKIFEELVKNLKANKKRTKELKKSKQKYSRLVDSMNEGLVEIDENWTITFTNTAFVHMTGLKPDQIIGKCFHDLLAKPFKKIASSEHQNHFAGKTRRYELELLLQNGKSIPVLFSPKPNYDMKGRYLGTLGVVTDISDIKRIEKERETLISELQQKLNEIKILTGLLPICSKCKKIRDDKGYWNLLESYIQSHSGATFTHGICPECSDELYGNEKWYIKLKESERDKGIPI